MSVALVTLAVLAGAVLQSATGFGFALVTAPVMFAVLGPGDALTILVLLATLLSALVLLTERRDVHIRWGDAIPLAAWGVPGLAAGILVLRTVEKPVLQVAVGVAVVAAASLELRGRPAAEGPPRRWPVAPVGVAAGTLATTVGVNGPPMVMYLLRTGADQHELRDTLSATFLLYTPLVLVALTVGGQLGLGGVGPAELAGLLALVLVGRPLGRAVFVRLDATTFRTVGLALALTAGVGSVVAGLA